jgi:hypothetical protein
MNAWSAILRRYLISKNKANEKFLIKTIENIKLDNSASR